MEASRFRLQKWAAAIAGALAISLGLSATPSSASAPVSEPGFVMTSPLVAAANSTGSDYTMVSCPLVVVDLKIKPHHLNLKSKGKWVTAYIIIPAGYSCSDFDISSIRLNGVVPVSMLWTPKCSKKSLKVKFLRSLVLPTLTEGDDVPVTVTGDIAGLCFAGTDYIRVKAPKVHAPYFGQLVAPGSKLEVKWDADPEIPGRVTIQLSTDGGASWYNLAKNQYDTGKYSFVVPSGYVTNRATIRVLTIYEIDDTGEVPEAEVADSDPFIISSTTGIGGSASAEFALRGATPSPAVNDLRISFSLKDSSPAMLVAFDLSGRVIEARRVDEMGPGWHTVTLGDRQNLPAGMYMIRLTQGGNSLTSRATLVR